MHNSTDKCQYDYVVACTHFGQIASNSNLKSIKVINIQNCMKRKAAPKKRADAEFVMVRNLSFLFAKLSNYHATLNGCLIDKSNHYTKYQRWGGKWTRTHTFFHWQKVCSDRMIMQFSFSLIFFAVCFLRLISSSFTLLHVPYHHIVVSIFAYVRLHQSQIKSLDCEPECMFFFQKVCSPFFLNFVICLCCIQHQDQCNDTLLYSVRWTAISSNEP